MNAVYSFIAELLKRFVAPTPKFFRIVRWLGIIAAVLVGVPTVLATYGIAFTDTINTVIGTVVSVASVVASIVAQATATTAAKKDLGIPE